MSLSPEMFIATSILYEIATSKNPHLDLGCDHWGRLHFKASWCGIGKPGDEAFIDIDGNIMGARDRYENGADKIIGLDGNPVSARQANSLVTAESLMPFIRTKILPIENAKDGKHIKEEIPRQWKELNEIANSFKTIILSIEQLHEYWTRYPVSKGLGNYVSECGASEKEITAALLLMCADHFKLFGWSEKIVNSIRDRYSPFLNESAPPPSFLYPEHMVRPSIINTGIQCPNEGCSGEIFERKDEFEYFDACYCSRSPNCSVFISNGEIINKHCPKCDSPFLVKSPNTSLQCVNPTCDYPYIVIEVIPSQRKTSRAPVVSASKIIGEII